MCFSYHMEQAARVFFTVFFNALDSTTTVPGWFNRLSGYTHLASKQETFSKQQEIECCYRAHKYQKQPKMEFQKYSKVMKFGLRITDYD